MRVRVIVLAVSAWWLMTGAVLARSSGGPKPEAELRGAWLKYRWTRPQIDRMLRKADRMNLNALYVMVWHGAPNWTSERFPYRHESVPDYDWMQYLLTRAHRRDIQVHAWFANASMKNSPPTIPESWQSVTAEGERIDRMDLTNPAVITYQTAMMIDFLKHYPEVDGLHFDHIRNPQSHDVSYAEAPRRLFEQAYGIDPAKLVTRRDQFSDARLKKLDAAWLQWRKDQITKIVRNVARRARRLKPDIILSAAVRNWQHQINICQQDWPRWLEQGYLNYAIPMFYANKPEPYKRLLKWYATLGETPFKRVIPSAGAFNGKAGTTPSKTATAAMRVYQLGQRAGARGIVFFWLSPMPESYVEAFRNGPFRKEAPAYTPRLRRSTHRR